MMGRSPLVLTALLLACGTPGPPGPTGPTAAPGPARDAGSRPAPGLVIEYSSPTAARPELAALAPTCVGAVQVTHMHPSWQGFVRVVLVAKDEQTWFRTFPALAPGVYSLRIDDVNRCDEHPFGTVSDLRIRVNGVLLTTPVMTPSDEGTRPGFSFRVTDAGVAAE